jgi:hypothetical protein
MRDVNSAELTKTEIISDPHKIAVAAHDRICCEGGSGPYPHFAQNAGRYAESLRRG